MKTTPQQKRHRRHVRIRAKVHGTAQRPRLSVRRTLTAIHAQLIDDDSGKTLAMASSAGSPKGGSKGIEAARKAGLDLASGAKSKSVTLCTFDRGGYRYHGRIKALAEGAREGGLTF